MIDIIPNWHPIFIHFAVALLSIAAGLSVFIYLLELLKGRKGEPTPVISDFRIVARWCLWFGFWVFWQL